MSPKKYLTIEIEILDYWLQDTYKLGVSYICYVLIKIGDKLKLLQRNIK